MLKTIVAVLVLTFTFPVDAKPVLLDCGRQGGSGTSTSWSVLLDEEQGVAAISDHGIRDQVPAAFSPDDVVFTLHAFQNTVTINRSTLKYVNTYTALGGGSGFGRCELSRRKRAF